MLTRTRDVAGCLGALLLLACGTERTPTAPTAARPDIFLFLVDTLRQDHLGSYGYSRDTTPRIDEFCRDAVLFENAYSTSSWTKPASASLLTGLSPLTHGMRDRRHRFAPDTPVVGEWLRSEGYHTAAFITNPAVSAYWGFDRGFDEFHDLAEEEGEEDWMDAGADKVLDRILPHLAAQPLRPLLYYIHAIDPHGPCDPDLEEARRFLDRPEPAVSPSELGPQTSPAELLNLQGMYDTEIYFSDRHFGRLLDALRERGTYDESLIVFVSDHGEEHLDHGQGGHAKTLFEEVLRVPLIVKLPGNRLAGKRVQTPCTLLDVLPTLYAVLGTPPPDHLEGTSLLSLDAARSRPLFFDLLLSERGKGKEPRQARAVLKDSMKYIEQISPDPGHYLFDLAADPEEQVNRAAQDLARAAELRALLAARYASRQAGVHLQFVGQDGEGTLQIQARVQSDGEIRFALPQELEEGDVIEQLGPSSLRVSIHLTAYRGPSERRARADVDAVQFRVDPPDARLTIESLEVLPDGDYGVFLGRDERPSRDPLPLVVPLDREELRWTENLEGSGATRVASRRAGAYLFVIPDPAEHSAEDLPDSLRQRLIHLGYLEDHEEE